MRLIFFIALFLILFNFIYAYNVIGNGTCICDLHTSALDCQQAVSDTLCSYIELNSSANITQPILYQVNITNKIFDCKNYVINEDVSNWNHTYLDTAMYLGIYNNVADYSISFFTIKNCNLNNFGLTILLANTTNDTFENIRIDKRGLGEHSRGITSLYFHDPINHRTLQDVLYNLTFRNITITNKGYGIDLVTVDSKFELLNMSNTSVGFRSSGNVSNSVFYNNYEFDVLARSNPNCPNHFSNVSGDGYPIVTINGPVNLSNTKYAELMLCKADNSNLTNVSIGASPNNNNYLSISFSKNVYLNGVNSSNNFMGLFIHDSENISIQNLTAENNIVTSPNLVPYPMDVIDLGIAGGFGIYMIDVNNSLINNSNLNNNNIGVLLSNRLIWPNTYTSRVNVYNLNNLIENSNVKSNIYYDVYMDTHYIFDNMSALCSNKFVNLIGTNNLPIVFNRNSALILNGLNVSEVILCNASNSIINITQTTGNNGLLSYYSDNVNVLDSVFNSYISTNLYKSYNFNISNSELNATNYAMLLRYGSSNIYWNDVNAFSNDMGITEFHTANNLSLNNSYVYGYNYAIYGKIHNLDIYNTSLNSTTCELCTSDNIVDIYMSRFLSNTGIGLYLKDSNGSIINNSFEGLNKAIILNISNLTLTNNTIVNNNLGIVVEDGYNLIYNNYFDNVINANVTGNTSYWNTTRSTTATGNIVYNSPPAHIGGNYWSDYDGWDTTGDYIGDTNTPYISNGVYDYLPLVNSSRVDNETPFGYLISPANNSVLLPSNVSFMWYGSDNKDENISTLLNISGNEINTYTLNNTNASYIHEIILGGKYVWNATLIDDAGNEFTTEYFVFYIDNDTPNVSLISPTNNSYFVNESNITLSYIVVDNYDLNLDCNVYVDNISIVNQSTLNNTVMHVNISNLSYGLHSWYVSCTDDVNHTGMSNIWYFVLDTNPSVEHVSPSNNSILNSREVSLICNVSDYYKLRNATLTIWDSSSLIFEDTVNVTNNQSLIWHVNLSYSTYYWSCKVNNVFNLSSETNNWTFSIRNPTTPKKNLAVNINKECKGNKYPRFTLFIYDKKTLHGVDNAYVEISKGKHLIETYKADNGYVTFTLSDAPDVSIYISAKHYKSYSDTLSYKECQLPMKIDVNVDGCEHATFISNTTNVSVDIEGQTSFLLNNMYSLSLPEGTYYYSARKPGFKSINGQFTVNKCIKTMKLDVSQECEDNHDLITIYTYKGDNPLSNVKLDLILNGKTINTLKTDENGKAYFITYDTGLLKIISHKQGYYDNSFIISLLNCNNEINNTDNDTNNTEIISTNPVNNTNNTTEEVKVNKVNEEEHVKPSSIGQLVKKTYTLLEQNWLYMLVLLVLILLLFFYKKRIIQLSNKKLKVGDKLLIRAFNKYIFKKVPIHNLKIEILRNGKHIKTLKTNKEGTTHYLTKVEGTYQVRVDGKIVDKFDVL